MQAKSSLDSKVQKNGKIAYKFGSFAQEMKQRNSQIMQSDDRLPKLLIQPVSPKVTSEPRNAKEEIIDSRRS